MKVREKMNDRNLEFYNNLEIDPFKLLAQIGGFNTYKDLEIVYPFVQNADCILEIGAGYGRCFEFLLKKKYAGKIIGVEQSPKLVAYLRKNFGSSAEILETRIQDLVLSEKVGAALWMWSGIIDFSYQEQKENIQKISSMLSQGGVLAIDVPQAGFKTIGEHQDSKHIVFESAYGTLQCYIPDHTDLMDYAAASALRLIHEQDYSTTTDKLRTIFVLQKI